MELQEWKMKRTRCFLCLPCYFLFDQFKIEALSMFKPQNDELQGKKREKKVVVESVNGNIEQTHEGRCREGDQKGNQFAKTGFLVLMIEACA